MIFLYDILLPKPPFPAETDVRACTPFQLGGGWGVKNSEKSLLGGSEIFILVGVYCWGGSVFSFCKMAGEQSIALLALEFEDQGAQIAHKFLTRFYCCIILSLGC